MDEIYDEAIYQLQKAFPEDIETRDKMRDDENSILSCIRRSEALLELTNTLDKLDAPIHLRACTLYECAQLPFAALLAPNADMANPPLSTDLLARCLKLRENLKLRHTLLAECILRGTPADCRDPPGCSAYRTRFNVSQRISHYGNIDADILNATEQQWLSSKFGLCAKCKASVREVVDKARRWLLTVELTTHVRAQSH